MHEFLLWVEQWPVSTFIRESPSLWGFPMFLFVHTVGMGVIAGSSTMVAFALLGLWPVKVSAETIDRIFTVTWYGFGMSAFTGAGLLIADASTKGANPDFWLKMLFVASGMTLMVRIRRRVRAHPSSAPGPLPGARGLAWASLLCWFGAIITGRLIAYVGPVVGL